MFNVKEFWNTRYRNNWRGSGEGSRGNLAIFKAWLVNSLITEKGIRSVVDLGCGDGEIAGLIDVRTYTGVDISPAAVELCNNRFATRSRRHFQTYEQTVPYAELALSLDVLYHILDDDEYLLYLTTLFSAALDYVIIYSCNFDGAERNHIRPRKFTDDIPSEWGLELHLPNLYPNESWSEFFIYKRKLSTFPRKKPPLLGTG